MNLPTIQKMYGNEIVYRYHSLVYFITDGDAVKVGITQVSNFTDRLKKIQVGNPRELEVIGVIPCYTRQDAVMFEEYFHSLFEYGHIRGEWFEGELVIDEIDSGSFLKIASVEVFGYPKYDDYGYYPNLDYSDSLVRW